MKFRVVRPDRCERFSGYDWYFRRGLARSVPRLLPAIRIVGAGVLQADMSAGFPRASRERRLDGAGRHGRAAAEAILSGPWLYRHDPTLAQRPASQQTGQILRSTHLNGPKWLPE